LDGLDVGTLGTDDVTVELGVNLNLVVCQPLLLYTTQVSTGKSVVGSRTTRLTKSVAMAMILARTTATSAGGPSISIVLESEMKLM
jgi:hypothetical protein